MESCPHPWHTLIFVMIRIAAISRSFISHAFAIPSCLRISMLKFCELNHIQVQRVATQSGFQLQRDCSCNNRSNTIYQQFASLSTCNVIIISYSFITRKSARYSRGFISLEMTICWRFQARPPTPVLYRHISRNCLLESTGRLTHSWFEMLLLEILPSFE